MKYDNAKFPVALSPYVFTYFLILVAANALLGWEESDYILVEQAGAMR